MSKELDVTVIREVVRGWPVEDVQWYANELPAQVEEGSFKFCMDVGLGIFFYMNFVEHNVSPAYELYEFLKSHQSAVQNNEVVTSGELNNATT